MYLHCCALDKPATSRLFIGPFLDETSANAFRERIERTREASPHLSSFGYAIEIAPGIPDGWAAIAPNAFHGFRVFDEETEEAFTVPLLES